MKAFSQAQYAFRVSFTDKHGTVGDLSRPEAFLSARALARRTRLGIAIDSTDLPVSATYTDSVLKFTSGVLHTTSRWQNNMVVLLTDTTVVASLRTRAFVTGVQLIARFGSPLHAMPVKDGSGRKDLPTAEKEASLMKTTGAAYYGDAYDQIHLANGDVLHNKGLRGKGMLIAVLDAGFAGLNTLGGFDSLRNSGRIVDTFNIDYRVPDVDGYAIHGTEVLSTMAGIIPDLFVGTAPDADYALYVTEDNGSEQPFELDNLVAGLERADSVGADVATISLGYNFMSIGTMDASLSLADIDGKTTVAARAANTATAKGMLVVASAGNDGGVSDWGKVLTPGDADSALTCGSVNGSKAVSPTSGRGPNAAGVLKPDVCMMGWPGIVLNSSGTTTAVTGTSIATPELAGLAACFWASNLKATPAQLRRVIRESAHLAETPDNTAGYGVPDFGKATLSFDSIPDLSQFRVGPNPFTGSLSVWTGARITDDLEWRLTDLSGRQLAGGTQGSTQGGIVYIITIAADVPAGTYILQLSGGGSLKSVLVQKMLENH
ncbi:MAG: S8 family peptidase [Chitinophagaceae bacterium]